LVMQAVVEHRGKLLRRVLGRKIRTANVANEQSVAGKERFWPGRLFEISHRDANALHGVSGSRKKIKAAVTELEGITLLDRCVREGGAGAFPEINARSSTLRELMMTGDEVGVQVCFDDVLDLQPLLLGGVEVDIDVALRINDRRDAFRTDQIGSVRQAPQEEMFHQNRCHNFSQRSVSDVRQARRIYYATENPRPWDPHFRVSAPA